MNKCEIIERLKNIAGHAVHTTGEEPFVISIDDGIAVHEAIKLLEKPEPLTDKERCGRMTRKTIDRIRERMCDEYCILPQLVRVKACNACPLNELEASAESKDWMEQNKDRILQAGKEGREVEFRIDGRLFAIREKPQ